MQTEVGVWLGILVGSFCISKIGAKLKIPAVVSLLALGFLVSWLGGSVDTNSDFLLGIVVSLFAVLVFDWCVRLRFHEWGDAEWKMVRFLIFQGSLLTIVISLIGWKIAEIPVVLSLLMIALFIGSNNVLGSSLKNFFERERMLGVPIAMVFPFIVSDMIPVVVSDGTVVISKLAEFWMNIGVGIGVGVVIGLLISGRKIEVYKVNRLMIVVVAIVALFLAELMGGNGVLAVAAVSLFVANSGSRLHAEQFKPTSKRVDGMIDWGLSVVGVIVGMMIFRNLSLIIMKQALVLFGSMLCVRLFVCWWLLRSKGSFHELIVASLNMSKGGEVLSVLFLISSGSVVALSSINLDNIVTVAGMIVLYASVLSAIIHWSQNWWLQRSCI